MAGNLQRPKRLPMHMMRTWDAQITRRNIRNASGQPSTENIIAHFLNNMTPFCEFCDRSYGLCKMTVIVRTVMDSS